MDNRVPSVCVEPEDRVIRSVRPLFRRVDDPQLRFRSTSSASAPAADPLQEQGATRGSPAAVYVAQIVGGWTDPQHRRVPFGLCLPLFLQLLVLQIL